MANTDARLERLLATPHYVYRTFDSYGLLLYVGCSVNVDQRMLQHRCRAWHRFAETIAVVGPFDRREALARESHAIETEGSYFNWVKADAGRLAANKRATYRFMRDRGDLEPEADRSRLNDREYVEQHIEVGVAWLGRYYRAQERLKVAGFPYLTDEDRLARYLAAREDAELARLEVAA